MKNRNQLIQLIHVGKRELALDDETYRILLEAETNKSSCGKMGIKELESVLSAMEAKGFKRRLKNNKQGIKKRYSPKSGKARNAEIDKIRAIWITMAKHEFIRDGSETALDAYVRRMTHRNAGDGVDHVAWCTDRQAYTILESLKNWHRRVMVDAMNEHSWIVPTNDTGKLLCYDEIANAYNRYLNTLVQQ
ncbi:regulatory protein GemA [Vibrio ruber]|uniref:gp16 family protein n=1 Tax=Vibrio ruber TaxID=184755 RepID=UPI0028935DBE|nr:regulatory protein GemA [Vibrio ruber]WNJ96561.1 regulatory protein GemA [Vibrio ruber]